MDGARGRGWCSPRRRLGEAEGGRRRGRVSGSEAHFLSSGLHAAAPASPVLGARPRTAIYSTMTPMARFCSAEWILSLSSHLHPYTSHQTQSDAHGPAHTLDAAHSVDGTSLPYCSFGSQHVAPGGVCCGGCSGVPIYTLELPWSMVLGREMNMNACAYPALLTDEKDAEFRRVSPI